MATLPTTAPTLDGLAASLAGLPQAETPRGGMEFGFAGVTQGATPNGEQAAEQENPFAGLGPVLEDPDDKVFKQTDGLVLRQELLAQNHLAQDQYYTCLVSGYPWATLTHDTRRDIYSFTLPYGTTATTIQAVPNKNLDLVNKAASTVLADFPEPDAEPIDDSEEAQSAADMANRFLTENASEQGTNDAVLFDDRLKRALVTASSYIEYWVDPTGGGYVPLQIKAHPQAVSPENPLVGPDGMPTTDYVLRYVTADGQFTDDASQAAPQWQPKLMATPWERTHIRVFPEDRPVHLAEKVIILGYCTLAEGKRRWKAVAEMDQAGLNALCDWTPPRFLVLLPPFQRARWKLTDGREKEKAGASDERIFFYYHILQRATPDYPKGANVVVSGVNGGLVIDRDLLASEVEVNKGQGKTTELRCREIPVVQVTPRGDPNGRDPSGLSYLEQFVGATENNAALAMGFSENVDKTNHTPYAVTSTSGVDQDLFEDAQQGGGLLIVTSKDDLPQQVQPPVLPIAAFTEMYDRSDEAINSIAAQERAASGQENSKERSGKALQIAISRNNIANVPMQTAVNNAVARAARIKLEWAMAEFTTPQLIKYQGEDGAYKEDEFTGVDFALVGKVSIKAGTGTMMAPSEKVNYLGNLRANMMVDDAEAKEAARPAFAKQLGLKPNPHVQYVERCIAAWLKGPPDGWTPAQPQVDPMDTPVIDIQTGQSAMTPPTWTPFVPRPNDTEPKIAAIWAEKLSNVMSTVKYTQADPAWRALLDQMYTQSRQAVALAQAAAQGGGAPPPRPAPHPAPTGQQPEPPQSPQHPQQATPTHRPGAAAA